MEQYLYELHMHTSPVSKCATASVRDTLEFYKSLGYAGVFISNHFIDGNLNYDKTAPYEERVNFYFSDYEEAVKIGREIGLPVFLAVESSFHGTDFLIFGLDKAWFLAHPEIYELERSKMLNMLREAGALVVQAHPFRVGGHVDHIRLFPKNIHGIEVYNGSRSDLDNDLAEYFAKAYGLLRFAGTDNHNGGKIRMNPELGYRRKTLGGVAFSTPLVDEADFIRRALEGEAQPFRLILTQKEEGGEVEKDFTLL